MCSVLLTAYFVNMNWSAFSPNFLIKGHNLMWNIDLNRWNLTFKLIQKIPGLTTKHLDNVCDMPQYPCNLRSRYSWSGKSTWFSHISNIVLRSSRISRKSGALIVRYSQKNECISSCFLSFWESFNCYNFNTTGPFQVGVSAKCTSPNDDFNQTENWKFHMFDFQLIPLDCITYIYEKYHKTQMMEYEV